MFPHYLFSPLLLLGFAHAQTGTFNVLSLNVGGLPEFLQDNGVTGDKTENTAAIGTIFAANRGLFDIIHVQEDFNYHATLYEYDNHEYRTPTSGGVPFGDGLNTLSNFNWIDFQRINWNECNGYLTDSNDCLTPKGFTSTRLQLAPALYLDAYNLHAEAGSNDADLAARNDNYAQLRAYIETHSAGNPVVVFGDTNARWTRASDTGFRALVADLGFTDTWVELAKGGDAPTPGADALLCENPAQTDECEVVDKILYRGSAAVELRAEAWDYVSDMFLQEGGEILTDHNAVMAEFSYSLSDALRLGELFGGPHGAWFNDLTAVQARPALRRVVLRGSDRLDGVVFTLADGTVLEHGGGDGDAVELVLDDGEFVAEARVCRALYDGENRTRVFFAELTTSTGRIVSAGTETDDCVAMEAPGESWGVVGAYGRAGEEVDELGLIWAAAQT